MISTFDSFEEDYDRVFDYLRDKLPEYDSDVINDKMTNSWYDGIIIDVWINTVLNILN